MVMARDKVKGQASKKGRGSNILAGRLQQSILNFGKAKVGE
jgi:hypothetical protein